MSLEETLAKIRSPNLQSQDHTRVVLESIEETLKEAQTASPTAYFAALLALLKQSRQPTVDSQNELTTSILYLLDLFTSHVPTGLLRSQFATLVDLLAPSLDSSQDNAPALRSTIGCLESILVAQDAPAWSLPQSQMGPRQAVIALLTLAMDARPKIRKRAAEALTTVLKNSPPGPSVDHPAAELCAIASQNSLKDAVDEVTRTRKHKGRPEDSHDPTIIHALQLTRTVATATGGWPSNKIEQLCEVLLRISRSRNEYLVVAAFEVFELIFDEMQNEMSVGKLSRLLDAIVELKPAANDSQLVPPWIATLSRGYGAYAEVEPAAVFTKLPELFDLVANFLVSPSHNIRVSASECLISFFANCIPDSAILEPSIYDEKVLQRIADRATNLLSVRFQTAWMEVFGLLSALFDALRWRADPYLLPVVRSIGELRGNEGFQGKVQADEVLGHAVRNMGPRAILSILPHNLSKTQGGQPGRAWLLPLFRDHVSNTELQHFKDELIPLSEVMYARIMAHGTAEKTVTIKVFETVVQQIWATLPGYCDCATDLPSAMNKDFAVMISNILYKQADLRVDVCRALQNLVESNQAILQSEASDDVIMIERRMTRAKAQENIDHLASLAANFLAVLFNVYSQTLPQSRAYILLCINAYLSITPEKDLVTTFEQTVNMLRMKLPDPNVPGSKKEPGPLAKNNLPPESHTLLDLIIALSIYLPRTTFATLFGMASNILTNPAILKSDPQLIKKAYKLIPRLATSENGRAALETRNSELQALILSTSDKTPVPARRDRLLAIQTLISFLPLTDLHFIPSVLSEIVLACKDTNEKARMAGFDTLLAATRKIANVENPAGTTIQNSRVPHMADDAPAAAATLEEVFTMTSAGLAGVAPHMIAASVTALSRLLFEYAKDERLSVGMQEELVDTVTMFLQSNNREIVRSVLGFVKVMVVVLPVSMLESRCEVIVPGLMVWSKENKGRLRAKVKGILERLMRRFGGVKVESWVGGEDKKMVVNIRKRRERARRNKKSDGMSDSEDDGKATGKSHDDAFEDTVYGSDAESDGSDAGGDDDVSMSGVSFKSGSKQDRKGSRTSRDQYIRAGEDDEEPLDLLDPRSMASISSSRRSISGRQQQPGVLGRKKSKATYNEDGKLVFGGDDEASSTMKDAEENEAAEGEAINSYLDAVSGPDAVRRGQKGKLKIKSSSSQSSQRGPKPQDRRSRGANGGGGGVDDMDLDVDEARQVARKIMQGATSGGGRGGRGSGGSPRSPGESRQPTSQNGRRGLGQDKQRGQSGPRGGSGSGGGRGRGGGSGNRQRGNGVKKGVRFSRHPRR